LRAAVLGANDGLVSNMSLVMGVADANADPKTILLTGLAGLVAGACSIALGEWLSVNSSRELYEKQISTEKMELEMVPEEEKEELVLIYQAKGLKEAEAHALADRCSWTRRRLSTRSPGRAAVSSLWDALCRAFDPWDPLAHCYVWVCLATETEHPS
jgi:VIT1/CCC1 family predicted Fe2+/Mn2+ transporter